MAAAVSPRQNDATQAVAKARLESRVCQHDVFNQRFITQFLDSSFALRHRYVHILSHRQKKVNSYSIRFAIFLVSLDDGNIQIIFSSVFGKLSGKIIMCNMDIP